jgi:hypothetical protein
VIYSDRPDDIEGLARTLRPFLRLPDDRGMWSPQMLATYERAAVQDFTTARLEALTVYSHDVAQAVRDYLTGGAS